MSSKASPTGSTPHFRTPLQQHSTPNTPALREQLQQLHLQQQQQQLQHQNAADASDGVTQRAFPPPQTFDILPSLHALLDQLLSASEKTETGVDGTGESGGGAAAPRAGSSAGSLDPKLLITEASAVKIRVQKARAAVDGLSDVERSVEEQEKEIKELEGKIEKLKALIRDFGERSSHAMAANGASR